MCRALTDDSTKYCMATVENPMDKFSTSRKGLTFHTHPTNDEWCGVIVAQQFIRGKGPSAGGQEK